MLRGGRASKKKTKQGVGGGVSALLPLHEAAKVGDAETTRRLLLQDDTHETLNAGAGKSSFTPLHFAVCNGHTDVAALLLDAGANVDAADMEGKTPLHWACYQGDVGLTGLLVQAGACLDANDSRSWTPLHTAAADDMTEVVQQLLSLDVDVNARTAAGETAEQLARRYGAVASVSILSTFQLAEWDAFEKDAVEVTVAAGEVAIGDSVAVRPVSQSLSTSTMGTAWELFCLEHDIQPEQVARLAPGALHDAAKCGDEKALRQLLDGASQDDMNAPHGTSQWAPLHFAASNGHRGTTSLLVKAGADPNAQDEEGKTPLHWAAFKGSVDTVTVLVGGGVDLDRADQDGCTALHVAVANEHRYVVRTLLDKGADPHARDEDGETPLMLAQRISPSILALFKGLTTSVTSETVTSVSPVTESPISGVSLSRTSRLGSSRLLQVEERSSQRTAPPVMTPGALHEAAKRGNERLVTALLTTPTAKDEINALQGMSRWTPLFFAASNGHHGTTKVLLEAGANVTVTDRDKRSALHWSAYQGNADVVSSLLEYGAHPDAMDDAGWTPLHLAAMYNNGDVIRILLERGADPTIINKKGRSVMDLVRSSAPECFQAMQEVTSRNTLPDGLQRDDKKEEEEQEEEEREEEEEEEEQQQQQQSPHKEGGLEAIKEEQEEGEENATPLHLNVSASVTTDVPPGALMTPRSVERTTKRLALLARVEKVLAARRENTIPDTPDPPNPPNSSPPQEASPSAPVPTSGKEKPQRDVKGEKDLPPMRRQATPPKKSPEGLARRRQAPSKRRSLAVNQGAMKAEMERLTVEERKKATRGQHRRSLNLRVSSSPVIVPRDRTHINTEKEEEEGSPVMAVEVEPSQERKREEFTPRDPRYHKLHDSTLALSAESRSFEERLELALQHEEEKAAQRRKKSSGSLPPVGIPGDNGMAGTVGRRGIRFLRGMDEDILGPLSDRLSPRQSGTRSHVTKEHRKNGQHATSPSPSPPPVPSPPPAPAAAAFRPTVQPLSESEILEARGAILDAIRNPKARERLRPVPLNTLGACKEREPKLLDANNPLLCRTIMSDLVSALGDRRRTLGDDGSEGGWTQRTVVE